jgi:deoxyribose-phosphate aldolase
MINPQNLAWKIDHTNLKPDATVFDIKKLCSEAVKYKFRNVCVNPTYTALAVEYLKDTQVGVCVVIGFPLGASTPKNKEMEALEAVQLGASELDMVMNIGQLKSGQYGSVREDIEGVVQAADGRNVKVILETALLNIEEKIDASLIARKAGAGFVKTSTGFGGLKGATVEDVDLLREIVGNDMGVKASGGIKDLESVLKMLDAGADRIGTSSGVQIMDSYRKVDI